VLPGWLEALHRSGMRRLIAFSTTGVLYKSASGDAAERRRIDAIAAAESAVTMFCNREQVAWTMFRPTLIYGAGRDGNIAAIARFIRRFGFFPLVGGGSGLRQPVHAEDLAKACIQALEAPRSLGNVYTLSGGQILAYRAMVEAVFRQLGRSPRLLPVPRAVLGAAIGSLRTLPSLRGLSPEIASRMTSDLCFDHTAAARDFGYRPGGFRLDARAVGVARGEPRVMPVRVDYNPGTMRSRRRRQ
jgi:nucleoside-diphosphate-sugar epimerase